MAADAEDAKVKTAREWDEVARGLAERPVSIFTITTTAGRALLEAVGAGPGARLLDVACGPGTLVQPARDCGAEFIGIDLAPSMIDEARRLHPDVHFRVGDAEQLEFADSAFDCVTSNFGVQMLPHPDRAFAQALRVLLPGGRYGFTTFLDSPKDDLFRLVQEAVAGHGAPVAPRTFWGPDDCTRRLSEAGFVDVSATEQILYGRIIDAKQVLDVISTAGRPWYLLKPQTPEARERIDQAIIELAERHRVDGEIVLRVATLLVVGRRP